MTMLDRMRRHRGWLKWTMGIVAVAMAAFFVPWHNRTVQLDEAVADVDGSKITAGEFRRELNQRLQMFQAHAGAVERQPAQARQALDAQQFVEVARLEVRIMHVEGV